MAMEVPPFVKKYWPYGLGAVIGIYIIVRMNSGGDDAAVDPTGAWLAGQANAAAANAATAAASAQQDKQFQLAQYGLNVDLAKSNNAAQIGNIAAQATMAQQLGEAGLKIIQGLQAPAIAAINAASQENQASLVASAAAAAQGIKSTADISAQNFILPNFANVVNVPQQTYAAGVVADANARQAASGAQAQVGVSANQSSASQAGSWAGLAAGMLTLFCDENVKENIVPLNEAKIVSAAPIDSASQIMCIPFVSYDYDETMGELAGKHITLGFTAQSLRDINPEWVLEVDGVLKVAVPALISSLLHANAQLTRSYVQLLGAYAQLDSRLSMLEKQTSDMAVM